MRVLALLNKETGEYTAFTVVDVEYDDEFNDIGFTSQTGYYYYVPNVSIQSFNYICERLVVNGYCDITSYGEIQGCAND